jgi:hypothetical protein
MSRNGAGRRAIPPAGRIFRAGIAAADSGRPGILWDSSPGAWPPGPAGQQRRLANIQARQAGGRLTVAPETSLIGCIGVLTVATRGTAGPGEVLVKIRGGSETYIAWSPTPLPKGATVLVIESRGSRTVDVSEWADPLGPSPDDPYRPLR